MIVSKKIVWIMSLVFMTSLLVVGCNSSEPTPVPTGVPTKVPTETPAEELEPTETPAPMEETAVSEIYVPEPGVYDFEDGTTQGWGGYGETAVSVSTESANAGIHSLLVTNRRDVQDGVAIDVGELLDPDKNYKISGYARVVEGEPESQFVFTMHHTPAGETAVRKRIASSPLFGTDDPDWVRLSGEYSFTGDVDELLLSVASPDTELVDFYIDDITVTEIIDPNAVTIMAPQTDIPSLRETFADDFLIGAALEPYQLNSDYHADLLTRHFNSMTPENVMKPVSIQPSEGNFTWDEADKLVAFARANDVAVHGHTLVWHNQVGDWMFEDAEGNPLEPSAESKELVLQRLETHIRAITERYQDDINVWDVVNEVVDETQEDCMRRSPWYELTGTDYIVTAFQVADDMLPDTTLIINDYATTDPAKRDCLYNLVQEMQAAGVPIDGMGMQMHVTIENPAPFAVEQTITLFSELGEVHITEVDMSIYVNDTDSYNEVPEDVLVKQGYRYKELFEVFTQQADKIESVTFWGMADDHTWLKTWPTTRLNLPLLFDEALQAKHAYWGIIAPEQLPILNQKVDITNGTPEIDGELDMLWGAQPWITLEATDGLTVSYQTRWDENNLYLLFMSEEVADNIETIDVFIDHNNGKTDAYEGDEQHLIFQGGVCEVCEDIDYVTAGDGLRNTLEVAIPLAEAAMAGDNVGFDIRTTRTSAPDAPISWNDRSHSQDDDTSKYGVLSFVEAARMITAVSGKPIIDGEEDDIWANVEEVQTEVWVLGDSGATGTIKTMWDDEHLYAYITVTDALLSKAASNPWEQDSIEVYLDQNNAKTTSYQADDGQYRINFDNEQSFLGGATAEKISSATRLTDDGYVVELAIQLDAIEPQEGKIIGFDFQINNDEDGSGIRDSVVTWNDPTHLSYQNTSHLGLLLFGP